jgi:hypothetical protein
MILQELFLVVTADEPAFAADDVARPETITYKSEVAALRSPACLAEFIANPRKL